MHMKTRLKIGGYQGTGSVHTRGLKALVQALADAGAPFEPELHMDVTAEGKPAGDLFMGIETGEYDLCYMASGYLTARVPSLGVLDVPFSISDRTRAYEALDGDVGARLSSDVRGATTLQVLSYWDNGFRHVTNSKRDIRTAADCDGIVVRTLNNQTYVDVLKALGFDPVITDVKDMVERVQNGTVDAQENPLTNLVNFGMHQYHRHVSMTGHIFGLALLVANGSWWASLSEEAKTELAAAVETATAVQRQASIDDDEALVRFLRDDGVSVLMPEEMDMAGFRAAASNVSAGLRKVLPADLCAAYLQV